MSGLGWPRWLGGSCLGDRPPYAGTVRLALVALRQSQDRRDGFGAGVDHSVRHIGARVYTGSLAVIIPQQNGMIERVFRPLKEQCVHRHRFETLQHASRVIADWIGFYNYRRPHQALGMKTPAEASALAA